MVDERGAIAVEVHRAARAASGDGGLAVALFAIEQVASLHRGQHWSPLPMTVLTLDQVHAPLG